MPAVHAHKLRISVWNGSAAWDPPYRRIRSTCVNALLLTDHPTVIITRLVLHVFHSTHHPGMAHQTGPGCTASPVAVVAYLLLKFQETCPFRLTPGSLAWAARRHPISRPL